MTRRLLSFLLALVLAFTLCACREETELDTDEFWGDEFSQSDDAPTDEPAAQITTFALPYLAGQNLDPVDCIDGIQQTVGALLYEGLFSLDETLEAQNVLCERYNYDAQSFTYTFTLRGDARFSDGSSLTAADVLATYRRAAESARYGARFASVTAMKAVDEHTLTVTLAAANAALPALLDIPIVKSGTEKNTVPLGTGPYVFVQEEDGAALSVSEGWRGETPPLAHIALVAAKDNDTALSLFSLRSVHFLRLDPTGTGARSIGGAVESVSVLTTVMQFLGFRADHALLAEKSVRHAMSGLLDREGLVSALLSGHGTAAQLPLSPVSAAYPRSAEYRTTASEYAAALSAAGVSVEKPRTLTLLVNEENSFKLALAESIAAQLSTDALTVELRALPWEDYLAALDSGSFDLYLGEVRLTADWDTGALIDADGALNYGGYTSEALSAQLDAFLAGGDSAYFDTFLDETPFAPLLFKSDAVLTPAGLIEGMTPTVSNSFHALHRWVFRLDDAEK